MMDPVGVIDPVEKVVDLGAKLTPRIRVVGVAAQLDRHAVIDRCHPAARIRAVVMAGAQNGLHQAQARTRLDGPLEIVPAVR